jgi:hypothetical protein
MAKFYVTGVTAIIIGCATIAAAGAAGPEYIPQGHIYSPESDHLPASQSRQAEIEARADEFEAERYQNQLNTRRNIEFLKLGRFDFGNPNNRLDNW